MSPLGRLVLFRITGHIAQAISQRDDDSTIKINGAPNTRFILKILEKHIAARLINFAGFSNFRKESLSFHISLRVNF